MYSALPPLTGGDHISTVVSFSHILRASQNAARFQFLIKTNDKVIFLQQEMGKCGNLKLNSEHDLYFHNMLLFQLDKFNYCQS